MNALNDYENFVLVCDLTIILLCHEKDFERLNYLKDFSLTDLISTSTCTERHSSVDLEVILTNKPKCFHNTSVFITGLGDCHKLILSYLRAHFKRLPLKKIFYLDYKSF